MWRRCGGDFRGGGEGEREGRVRGAGREGSVGRREGGRGVVLRAGVGGSAAVVRVALRAAVRGRVSAAVGLSSVGVRESGGDAAADQRDDE